MSQDYILKLSVKKALLLFILIPAFLQNVLNNFIESSQNVNWYYFFYLLFALLYLPYFYWFNCAVKFLHSKSKKKSELKLNRFTLSLRTNIILVFNFVFLIAYIFSFPTQNSEEGRNSTIIITLLAIQSLSIISFFYNTFFVIRLLNIEKKDFFFFKNIFIKLFFLSHPLPALWLIQTEFRKIQMNSASVSNLPTNSITNSKND